MKRRHNHTIMDGRVVTFAEDFEKHGDGVFGAFYDSVGPYEVSASRNRVMVHRAEIENTADILSLKEALDKAYAEHLSLANCEGRPRDGDKGDPRPA